MWSGRSVDAHVRIKNCVMCAVCLVLCVDSAHSCDKAVRPSRRATTLPDESLVII